MMGGTNRVGLRMRRNGMGAWRQHERERERESIAQEGGATDPAHQL